MSIGTTTIAINANIRAPEIGDAGYIGVPDPNVEHIYDEDWGANFYTFGWIYAGLKSVGLITKEIEDFKEFLEAHFENKILTFIEGGDDPEESNVDWENLTAFSPSAKPEFKNCSYQILNIETGESFESETTDLLIPGKYELSEEGVKNFIEKLNDAEEINDSFTNVSPLIDPYADLGEISQFIALHRSSKLEIIIKEA